jgi:hypothetical protein
VALGAVSIACLDSYATVYESVFQVICNQAKKGPVEIVIVEVTVFVDWITLASLTSRRML